MAREGDLRNHLLGLGVCGPSFLRIEVEPGSKRGRGGQLRSPTTRSHAWYGGAVSATFVYRNHPRAHEILYCTHQSGGRGYRFTLEGDGDRWQELATQRIEFRKNGPCHLELGVSGYLGEWNGTKRRATMISDEAALTTQMLPGTMEVSVTFIF